MIKVTYIRNSIAAAGFLVLAYLLFTFISGNAISGQINGEFVCPDTSSRYVFTDNIYSCDTEIGTYRIRGNRITFLETGKTLPIRVHRDYIVIDGQHFLRR